METLTVKTHRRHEMIDVTERINDVIAQSGIEDGIALIYVPHTTAGMTINENADPDVVHDILLTLEDLVPHFRQGYQHGEGNSDAHVKASLMGPTVTVMVEKGRMQLGTWQGIYFCEFDGPRTRRLMVKIS